MSRLIMGILKTNIVSFYMRRGINTPTILVTTIHSFAGITPTISSFMAYEKFWNNKHLGQIIVNKGLRKTSKIAHVAIF